RFLQAAGYDVVTAASAEQALDILAGRTDVDLLFSDVVLGSGMNGIELAQSARRGQPGLAVLLTSGHEFQGGDHTGRAAEEGFELLPKPYRREQLLGAIRSMLERR
ncbi:MAG: response regulator, partial [Xanthomonadaceae bacterium]|nr:response regulator [Xanthomonadaceae bacterium]